MAKATADGALSREAKIESLVVNGAFEEQDVDFLLSLPDRQFDRIEAQAIKANAAEELEAQLDEIRANDDAAGGASRSKSDTDEDGHEGEDEEDEDSARLEKNKKGGGNKANAKKKKKDAEDDADGGADEAEEGDMKDNAEVTLEQLLDKASPAIREGFETLQREHDSKKLALVKSLKANKRNRYTDEELGAMSLKDLQRITELAAIEPDYSGQAGAPKVNENKRAGLAPEMPKMAWDKPRK